MLIRARAPLRLGLAGGGTDLSPYCELHGGYVLNGTIDRYAYAVIRELESQEIRFRAADLNKDESTALAPFIPLNGGLDLHRAVYNTIVSEFNHGQPIALELTTFCDAPAGSGLGSSSTLVVVMIRAFAELLNLPLDDYAIAHLAFRIERVICGHQGGRQDQYSATFGGFNFMEFYADDRAVINTLRIKNYVVCELEASLLLFYTGVSRVSAEIIADQSANISSGGREWIDAMDNLKREAQTMKECLLKGDFNGIAASMQLSWENKKRTAKSVTTPLIESIYDSAIAAGATAGKVSGAGGGGFMMLLVPPERRMDVIRALGEFEGLVSNCHFTSNGTQAWKV